MEEIGNQSLLVCGVVVGLVVLNLGVLGVIRLVVLSVILLCAVVVAFLLALYSSCRVDETIRCSRVVLNKVNINLRHQSRKPINQSNSELTGCAAVDAPIREMIDHIMKFNIDAWYKKISSNPQFPGYVRNLLCRVVWLLKARIEEVDWIQHMTTTLVDDIASHLRLYKVAINKLRAPLKEGEARQPDLETAFFDAEIEMEGRICRDSVCLEPEAELKYLQDLSELLLYLLLPTNEFETGSVRVFAREILSSCVLQPVLHLLSDPDFINQNVIWILKDFEIRSDVFITTLRHSESLSELEACRSSILKELSILRSRDSQADDTDGAKNQLNSLLYLKKVVDGRINRLQSGFSSNSYGLPANIDWSSKIGSTAKLFNLPLEVILKNNISLSYFIDYMSSIGCQYMVFFFLNIEGWKVAAEQQLLALELEILRQGEPEESHGDDGKILRKSTQDKESCLESIRDAAISIYQEYLSEKSTPRIQLDDTFNKRLILKIRTETPDPGWFDEVAGMIYHSLETEERYLISFKRSVGYLKLLAELDLLKVDMYEEDEESSLGESFGESGSAGSLDNCSVKSTGGIDHYSSSPETSARFSSGQIGRDVMDAGIAGDRSNFMELLAEITRVEMDREPGGKQFAVYVVKVTNNASIWEITRRYSDFHFLQTNLNSEFPTLESIKFPGKKTFGNLERNLVQKRQKMLDEYLKQLLHHAKTNSFPGLGEELLEFLLPGWSISRPGVVERAVTAVSQDIQRSVKSVSNVVTAVPRDIVRNVDNVFDGIHKVFVTKDVSGVDALSSVKVGASIEDNEENIPLRITLLFLDEVFDLVERNMWLRRQIITVLRQIINTMLGGIVNKKIVDYIRTLTSEEAIAGYLTSLKDSLWPGGQEAPAQPKREEDQKQRCRVAARAALLASLPDDLRRVIGSETSRTGMEMIFNMLQYSTLNRRLVIVLLEGVILLLFPNHNFQEMFEKLHSRSLRTRDDLKNSQRTASDLRHRREKSK